MKLGDINIRDPFILAHKQTGKYYMYASSPSPLKRGFCAYVSEDLENWSEPAPVFEAGDDFWATDDFWAPEVHEYQGRYYLFGTFSAKNRVRTSQILVADGPMGPFRVHSKPLAPDSWYALDATLYVDNGVPYAVFSHEWLQTDDGEMCCVRLSDDLTEPIGDVKVLFTAGGSGWAKCPVWNKGARPIYVVDAPFVCRIDGVEFMLWSSWASEAENGYAVGAVYPEHGGMLGGHYRHEPLELPEKDSGHAMVFRDFNGDYRIAYHENNSRPGCERAAVYYVGTENGEVKVYENKKVDTYYAYDCFFDGRGGLMRRVQQG